MSKADIEAARVALARLTAEKKLPPAPEGGVPRRVAFARALCTALAEMPAAARTAFTKEHAAELVSAKDCLDRYAAEQRRKTDPSAR